MAFWDNIGQKASETTAKAMQKAKEISDIAKMNTIVSEEEKKINNTYCQIGKLYVTMHLHDYEEEFAEMISSFAQAEEKIRNYRQQIQDIKGVICCSQCGAEVQSECAFCSSCGAPVPKVQTKNMEELERCESCGAMVKKGVRFCIFCGKPMTYIAVLEETDTPVIESEVQNRVCPNCGASVEGEVFFCVECGTKL